MLFKRITATFYTPMSGLKTISKLTRS